jgi:hypothetical protein
MNVLGLVGFSPGAGKMTGVYPTETIPFSVQKQEISTLAAAH